MSCPEEVKSLHFQYKTAYEQFKKSIPVKIKSYAPKFCV